MALNGNSPKIVSPRQPGIDGLCSREQVTQVAVEKKHSLHESLAVCVPPKKKAVEYIFDPEYLRRLKGRDPKVTDHFQSYFGQKLRLKLRGRRLRQPDVDDIVQDTFLSVLTEVDKESIRIPAAFGGFVSRVCDFVYYGWLERYKKRYESHLDVNEIDILDPVPGADILLVRRERRNLVEQILESMRSKDRNLLRAKLFDELSNEEIRKILGASPASLRTLLCRARKKFADAWKNQN